MFDPDAYLQSKATPQSGFDPDAYLQSKQSMQTVAQPTQQPSNQVAPPIDLKGAIQDRLVGMAKDAPRAGGVALRNVIEGVGGMVDFLGSPIRAGITSAGLPDPAGGGQMLADYLNLPQPANPTERVISEAEKILAGGGGLVGLAGRGAQAFGGTAQKVSQAMAARPELQAASMVGAGTAGGYVKEEGGGPWEQLAAAVVGGLAAPAALAGGQKTVQFGKNMIDSMRKTPNIDVKIETVINSALESRGVPASSISSSVKNQLNKDIKSALDVGDISPDAVRRLVDYRLTGATPTAGPISLDPAKITQQQNLMKIGAQSKDPRLQQLSKITNENQRVLIENLNNLGAGTVDDQIATAEKVMASLSEIAKSAKGKIDPLYAQARDTVGRSAKLDPRVFTQRANDILDEKLLGGKLPSDIRNKLNSIAKGETPLTVDVAEQLKTNMGTIQRASKDGAERMAIGAVREALEATPLLDGQGKAALAAFNVARQANSEWMSVVNKTPALKAVMDGIEPDKFMQSYVIGQGKDANIQALSSLKNVIKDDVGAQSVIKNYMARYIKEKALGDASDEVGRFSQSNFNKTLKSIGDRKLSMFFKPEEVNMLKAIGRVASYEQAQPAGSAVNNSNTAATAISSMLDWLGSVQLLRKIPFGAELVGRPAQSITQNIQATQALKPGAAAAIPRQAIQRQRMGAAPAAALAAQGGDNRSSNKVSN